MHDCTKFKFWQNQKRRLEKNIRQALYPLTYRDIHGKYGHLLKQWTLHIHITKELKFTIMCHKFHHCAVWSLQVVKSRNHLLFFPSCQPARILLLCIIYHYLLVFFFFLNELLFVIRHTDVSYNNTHKKTTYNSSLQFILVKCLHRLQYLHCLIRLIYNIEVKK